MFIIVGMTNKQPNLNTALHNTLLSLSETSSGFASSEVTGYSPEQVRRAAEALVKAGRIVRCTVSPRRVRYFANDKLAQACAAGRARMARPSVGTGLRAKALWRPDQPAIITPRTKVFIAPPLPRNVFRTNTYTQF